jgi:D-Tyr-tRNAtyr deacylase
MFGFSSCSPNSPIPEADYKGKLVGDWLGTVGDTKETMSFKVDGSFVGQVRPAGFIRNTLSQGTTDTIRGTWTITGKVITMKITGADNENMQNKETSSAIVTFSQNELVVRSVSGETATFMRAI